MADTTNIQVFQLSSGTLVISEVVKAEGSEVVLRYPLEMNFTYEETGVTGLYLNRFMPYSEDDLVKINANTVESQTVCSQKYQTMYGTRIAQFKQAMETTLDTSASDEESPDEDDDGLDQFDLPTESKPNTFH